MEYLLGSMAYSYHTGCPKQNPKLLQTPRFMLRLRKRSGTGRGDEAADLDAVGGAGTKRQPDPLPGVHQRQARHSDRKSTRLNSSHMSISYAVFCLKKK